MSTFELTDFDVAQIADSGQCFRMYQTSNDTWEVFSADRFLKIRKHDGFHTFECPQNEFDNFWFNYFDLQTDYGKIRKRIFETNDDYLIRAATYGSGLRILRQDLWEVIVSFVISQQNNIPRIIGCIKKLCDINGGKFPQPYDFLKFSKEELATVKLGYRENYLLKISESILRGNFDLENLENLSYLETMKKLKSLHGVGEKVANCVALFALHHTEAFPIDVWIKKIIENRYGNKFSIKKFGLQDVGGIVQQYMYFYERSLSSKNPN